MRTLSLPCPLVMFGGPFSPGQRRDVSCVPAVWRATTPIMTPRGFRTAWLLFIALAFSASLRAAANRLEEVEKSAGEWVKLRMESARLASAWQAEQGLLESTVQALEERATQIEEERDLLKAQTAKEREEMAGLKTKEVAANAELQAAEARLLALSQQLVELRPKLPPRLSDALEMSYRSLAEAELPLGERMQLCMTVLNRCAQFNRLVSYGEEVLSLEPADGPKALEVIYWGLARGYALDGAAGKVWMGSPGANGWRWEPQPDATDAVAELIAIHTDKADPDFVLVPASLGHVNAEDVP